MLKSKNHFNSKAQQQKPNNRKTGSYITNNKNQHEQNVYNSNVKAKINSSRLDDSSKKQGDNYKTNFTTNNATSRSSETKKELVESDMVIINNNNNNELTSSSSKSLIL